MAIVIITSHAMLAAIPLIVQGWFEKSQEEVCPKAALKNLHCLGFFEFFDVLPKSLGL
jgi:hypothetical protein